MVEKTRIIDIYEKGGAFSSVFRRFSYFTEEYNSSDMSLLRKLFSNEKAKLLYIIKNKQPKSIYSLAKILERDFKSVREDILLLRKFGFIELIADKKGRKVLHRPIITANTINISVRI